MDAARFRRWFAHTPILAALAAGVGCKSDAAERVPFTPGSFSNTFSKYGDKAVSRSQAPEAPVVPLTLGPSQSTPAQVVPYTPPPPSAGPTVTAAAPTGEQPVVAVSVNQPALDKAATQVRVVALIGSDIVITDDEVWQLVRQQAAEYARLTGPERDAKEKEMFRYSLRGIIERELIIADFLGKVKKNKPELVDEIFERAAESATREMREFKKRNKIATDEELDKAFRAQGLAIKSLQRQMERSAIVNMYLGQVIKEHVKKIGLAQIDQYYRAHPDEFRIEDEAKWMDLFVSYSRFDSPEEARKYAEGLQARAKANEDFEKLVMTHGHGDSPLRHGVGAGEKRGEILPPEVEPTVFSLAPGQVSGLVPTERGLHVVKLVERQNAGIRPYDEKTQQAIREKLTMQVREKERLKLIEELWRKTSVKVVDIP